MVPLTLQYKGIIPLRIFLSFLFASLLVSLPGLASAQQTPANTVCNEKSGLRWQMNSEADMKEYTIYVANMPGIATANPPVSPLIKVPHDPSKTTIDENGNKVVSYNLDVTMAEGDKYFTVIAGDLVGNLSGHSNEIGCEYNTSPSAPIIKLLFGKPKS